MNKQNRKNFKYTGEKKKKLLVSRGEKYGRLDKTGEEN